MKGWKEQNQALTKTFKFDSFKAAIAFMKKTALAIDNLNHHPEWTNIYNTVQVKLTTHDAGNTITDKDKELAALLDDAFDRFNE